VGKTITKFSSALARRDIKRAEGMIDSEPFKLVSVQGPASVIPMAPGVRRRPVRNPRDPRNYRGFTGRELRQVNEFMRGAGRIPYRLTRISISSAVEPRDGKMLAHYNFTGQGTGRPAWRRDLQVSGKGAIDCDGTMVVFVVLFRAGNTGIPRTPSACSANRTLSVVSGARICTRSRAGYRFWKRREAR